MSDPTLPAVIGQTCRVELCPCRRALVLSVGPMSVRLDVDAAEDVAATLAFALQRFASRRSPDRRGFATGGAPDELDVPEPSAPDSN